ncbi:MAG: aldehyde ferredoxin oxidoreductase family protein [Clostridiales bacterium]|nr:aldehyde ferredoxin oxidoreductase family protein [Clostridiales bacterium]
MYGFHNKLLRIDLTKKSYKVEKIGDEVFRKFLGGKGLGSYLLLKENPKGVDPLSLENKLLFVTGSLSDTKMQGSSRYGVFTKSPLTGIYSEAYSGGSVAPVIKKTGYDAIIIEGKSDNRTFLVVSDEGVEFRDASHLWGLDAYKTEDAVKEEVNIKRAQAVVIGPGGENLVKYACISNDYWRCAGRTGVGAVMGSKNVKAIVFHGNTECKIADPELMNTFVKDLIKKNLNSAGVKAYKKFGTPMLVAIMNSKEGFPTEYWHKGSLETWDKISAEAMQEEMDVKPKACIKCFVACGKLSKIKNGKFKGTVVEGPEYETLYVFGGLCCIDDINAITYLNDLCDRMGIDTMSTGNMVAFAIDAAKLGKLDLDIKYGDVDKVVQLIEDIAYRRGIGNLLADGIKIASKELGLEDLAIHVKGLEPSGYDPRVLKGMGLAYATAHRGACHLRATFYKPELSGKIDPDQIEGKAKLFVEYEDRLTLFDTYIMCRFYRDMLMWDELSILLKASTGLHLGEKELREIATNIVNTTREFNVREGVTMKDDSLPKRFHDDPIGSENKVITREDFNQLLADYYKERGWTKEGETKRTVLI